MLFTDEELVMLEEALEYWKQVVGLDFSNVELRTYQSALTKITEALEAV